MPDSAPDDDDDDDDDDDTGFVSHVHVHVPLPLPSLHAQDSRKRSYFAANKRKILFCNNNMEIMSAPNADTISV